jgi:hypothetical protein
MLPKDIRPGDRVWTYLPGPGYCWAVVQTIAYDPAWSKYVVKYARARVRDHLGPRTRFRVRRDWDAWPIWHGTPPCPGCGQAARLAGGTAMLRHTDQCPVNALQRAQISNGHMRPSGEEQQ